MFTRPSAKASAYRRLTRCRRGSFSTYFLLAAFAFFAGASFLNTLMSSILSQKHDLSMDMKLTTAANVDGPPRINLRIYPKPIDVHQIGPNMPLSQSQCDTPLLLDEVDQDCVNIHSWQSASYSSCNLLHDLELTSIKVINCGSNRCAFLINEQYESRTLALKMCI